MADYLTNTTDLTKVANAIRTKGGTTEPLTYPDEFVTAIEDISGGGSSLDTITVHIEIDPHSGITESFDVTFMEYDDGYDEPIINSLTFYNGEPIDIKTPANSLIVLTTVDNVSDWKIQVDDGDVEVYPVPSSYAMQFAVPKPAYDTASLTITI